MAGSLAERRSKTKGYCRLVGRSAGVRRSKIKEIRRLA
jgi:hypothetical protein